MQKILLTFFAAICLLSSISVFGQTKTKTAKKTEATTEKVAEKPVEKVAEKAGDTKVEIEHLTKESFKKLIWDYEKSPQKWIYSGELPCIIDFYANWCGPCRQLAPKLAELAQEYEGKIKVYKINIDQERELAAIFGIKPIPAVLFIPKEGQAQMATGNQPKEYFETAIKTILLP